jgi:hypothetical protein
MTVARSDPKEQAGSHKITDAHKASVTSDLK